MKYSVVCEKIRALRIERGLTQVELAQRLGVSKSVISSYENAVHLPPYDILVKLSTIFHVSCDSLLGIEDGNRLSTDGLTATQIKAIESIISELRDMNTKTKAE